MMLNFIPKQRGTVLVLMSVMMVVFLGFSALVVDIGMMENAKIKLKYATESAALAGADMLTQNSAQVTSQVQSYLNANPLFPGATLNNVVITQGAWNDDTNVFDANAVKPDAVKVTAEYSGQYFFGTVFNMHNYQLQSTSIATVVDKRPLDLIFVVDLTSNMSMGSQLQSIATLGSTTVLDRLQAIYAAIGSPVYGSMEMQKVIQGPRSNQAVLVALDLDKVAYPYVGSWDDYVTYVKNLTDGGGDYQQNYGYITLMNYWQQQATAQSSTPMMWKTPEEPLKTLKTGIAYLTGKLRMNTDRAGLVVVSNTPVIEQNPSFDLAGISSILTGDVPQNIPGRQAGHYGPGGTIVNAMNSATTALVNDVVTNEKQVIVLIAQGATAWDTAPPDGLYNTPTLVSDKIFVHTLMIGTESDANMSLMLTSKTRGKAFSEPLSSTDYTATMDGLYDALMTGPPRIVQ